MDRYAILPEQKFLKIQGRDPLFPDLLWNIPEQKSGNLLIIGGNSQNFANIAKTAAFAANHLNFRSVQTLLPDALKSKIPPSIENISFAPSTPSGSFAKSAGQEITNKINSADFTIILGDLSKNSETAIAITEAVKNTTAPILLTRDTIDLLAETAQDFIERQNLHILATLPQVQKLFRALYYPRPITLSMPLYPLTDALHKFTLTYDNLAVTTFSNDKVLTASSGKIIQTALENTPYSPLSLWSGELAAKIAELTIYNSTAPLESTAAALLA
jgi:hypothetical protein